jgi:Flp pilus assembly protein TadG
MFNPKSQRGQALVLIALAAVGLFAFAALAIDGGMVFSDKRHAQNAADTSALSAALAKVRGQNLITAAMDRAASNGFTNDGVRSVVQVYNPPISGPYTGNNEYIQVVITSNVRTTFARIIGRRTVTNVVEAVARATVGSSGTAGYGAGYGLTTLKQNGTGMSFTGSGNRTIEGALGNNAGFDAPGSGTFNVTGGVQVSGFFDNSGSGEWNVGGNVWVNGFDNSGSGDWSVGGSFFSDDDFSTTGSGDLTAAGGITVVGTAYPPGGSGDVSPWPPASGSYTTPPVITDPFATVLFPPANPGSCTAVSFGGSSNATINPGCYTSITRSGSGDLTLNPGVYYITGNINQGGSGDITAHGVLLYMENGSFDMNGSGSLNISPMTSGPYAGLTIYMDRDNTSMLRITGSGGSLFSGTIYAPSSNVILKGSGGTFVVDSQIICSTSELTGSGDLNLKYDPSHNFQPIPATTPLIQLTQ